MSEDYGDDYDDSGERTVSELEEVRSTLKEISSKLEWIVDTASFFLWVMVAILVLHDWSGSKLDRWTDKVWYSVRYDTDFKNVIVERRPMDCDFFHAPLGDKGCEYKKDVLVFDEEQRQALIKRATTAEEQQTFAKQPNSVGVHWEKKEE